jgi:hypothetical protein
MSQADPSLREKFTRLRVTARQFTKEYFQRYPKDRYMTEIESWRDRSPVLRFVRRGLISWANKRRSAGGTGPNILPSNDVRFCAHNGLIADIRPCPLCADIVAKVFLRGGT